MEMAVDTFVAYIGVYPSVESAESDYQLVKDLHNKAGMLDAYDAAVIEKREDGKVRITKKHETPTRVGGELGLAWPPGSSWRCSRSPPSVVGCSRPRRPVVPYLVQWPGTPPPA
jgi:hypothetical protein